MIIIVIIVIISNNSNNSNAMENSDQSYNWWLPYQTNQKKIPGKETQLI